MVYTVYMHRTPSNKVYIGITSKDDVAERFGPDGVLYRNQFFGRAIKKYGWDNIEHIVIKTGLTEDEAKAEEIRLIAQYNSADPHFGYNCTLGGDIPYICGKHHTSKSRCMIGESNRGKIRSAEVRMKIRESVKRLWTNAEYRNKQMSRTVSEDTRIKQSLAKLGRAMPLSTRQKISESNRGKHTFTDEQRSEISEAVRLQHLEEKRLGIRRNYSHNGYHSAGSRWYNNGVTNVRCKDGCPDGFVPGRISKKKFNDVKDVF